MVASACTSPSRTREYVTVTNSTSTENPSRFTNSILANVKFHSKEANIHPRTTPAQTRAHDRNNVHVSSHLHPKFRTTNVSSHSSHIRIFETNSPPSTPHNLTMMIVRPFPRLLQSYTYRHLRSDAPAKAETNEKRYELRVTR